MGHVSGLSTVECGFKESTMEPCPHQYEGKFGMKA
jgi:hypothetical protein